MLRYAGLQARLLPAEGRRLENLLALLRVSAVRRRFIRPSFPPTSELQELPLVPYVLGPGREIVHDSSAVAEWLDARPGASHPRLLPAGGAARFAARIIDEHFDEAGLYCAHHNRWVVSAGTNDAGDRLAREFATLIPRSLHRKVSRRFSARQVRRLPYLFSVAPAEPERYDVPLALRPPGRVGFPPTHEILDAVFRKTLDAVEHALVQQPFLLGERFSVADASCYGQLAMNMSDPTAAAGIEIRAPATSRWIHALAAGGDSGSTASHELRPELAALLEVVGEVFVPLMRQNEAAYEEARARGERLFNEAAFDRGRALYDGVLLGRPFRAVVKTFQVKVWRSLKREWQALSRDEHASFPFSLD